jgi:lactate dehydrogenase-like 2-hydroxyacid dehydrogenase
VGLIAIFGVGTDAVDLEYVRSRQIQVSITSGVLTNDVADLAMGLLLAGSRSCVRAIVLSVKAAGRTEVCRWLLR